MKEVWKDIVGYEGYYQISNYGKVKSCERYVNKSNGGKKYVGERIMKLFHCPGGYPEVLLTKNSKAKPKLIHRLVAEAFIDNPNNYPEVNHKDEDKDNNCVENLEWCTSKYNANYGTRNEKMSMAFRKPIIQKDIHGNVIKRWDSIKQMHDESGMDMSSVISVCKGRKETHRGYKWEYAEPQVV